MPSTSPRRGSIGLAAVPSIQPAAEADAVQGLYERHSTRIFRFCLSRLRTRDEAEDAVQTTFLYALGALRRGVVPETEIAWLLKIAQNVCLSRHDAVRRRGNVELARDPQTLAELAPARESEDIDLLSLAEAVGRLPERQRRAILLREWQGLSYSEIAAELEVTEAAVETLLFRARRTLAQRLGGDDSSLRRRLLDGSSLFGAAKSVLGGGAAKVVVGVAAVATVGTVASRPLVHRSHPERSPAPQPAAVVPRAPESQDSPRRFVRAAVVHPARKTDRRSGSAGAAAPAGSTATAPPSVPSVAPADAPVVESGASQSSPAPQPAPTPPGGKATPVPKSEPAVSVPPVKVPPVTVGPVSTPPVSTPPVTVPPVKIPPITVGPVSTPPISTPPVTVPPVELPPVSVPIPPVSPPAVPDPPTVTVPPVTLPAPPPLPDVKVTLP